MCTFITGSSGFVGLALTEALLRRGQHVLGLDASPPPEHALNFFNTLPGTLTYVTGDIRDVSVIDAALGSQHCETLVTLAAITADASRERRQPGLIYEVNVAGALNAIAAGARHGVSRFVHLSSGSVYGKSGYESTRLDEIRTPPQPEGLYGMSKLAAECAISRYRELHEIDLVIGRLGTCFGPWEYDTGFRDTLSAPLQLLKLAQSGQPAVLPYDSTRDWLYIRDAADAITCLINSHQLTHPIYNVAAGFEFSMSSWCRQLQTRYPAFQWRIAAPNEPGNVNLYSTKDRASMNIDKLISDTSFHPQYDMSAAFHDYIDWQTHVGKP